MVAMERLTRRGLVDQTRWNRRRLPGLLSSRRSPAPSIHNPGHFDDVWSTRPSPTYPFSIGGFKGQPLPHCRTNEATRPLISMQSNTRENQPQPHAAHTCSFATGRGNPCTGQPAHRQTQTQMPALNRSNRHTIEVLAPFSVCKGGRDAPERQEGVID